MTRHFKTVNYQEALQTTVRLDDCLPQDHLVRFIADVVEDLDLSEFYAYYERNQAKMQYDQYLSSGWPIASGVIEGACRHLVKDCCELSGMR
jgi:hypothetical protein